MSGKAFVGKRGFALSACAAVVALAGAADEAQAVRQMERYCVASWRNARIVEQDWSDCTQQALTELLERVPRERLSLAIEDAESAERRELNRSIWRIIQRWRRAPRLQGLEAGDPADTSVAAEPDDHHEVREALAASGLKEQQRRILLAWSQGRKIAEIAAEMQLSPARVSDEKYKAVQILRKSLAADLAG